MKYDVFFILVFWIFLRLIFCRFLNNKKMIYVIDGNPGCGKSLYLNMLVNRRYQQGQAVFLNWNVNYGDGVVERWHEFDEVIDVSAKDDKGAVIGVDEAYKIFDAHRWMSLPLAFSEKLAEHRHDSVDLFTATQNFSDLDLRVRNKTGVWFHLRTIFRFPFRQNIPAILQLSVIEERRRVVEKNREVWKIFATQRLWISRFFTKKFYNSFENLKLSKYICRLKIDNRGSRKIKKMIIASRDLVARGRVRGF